MFCGTTVDLMAKMMTAGRRLVAFWRIHSILEGSGWSSRPGCHWHWAAFWSAVLAACPGSARPSQLSTARWQPVSPEQRLVCQKGCILSRQSMGYSGPLHPVLLQHQHQTQLELISTTSWLKPRSKPHLLGKAEAMIVSINTPVQRGWPLLLQQRVLFYGSQHVCSASCQRSCTMISIHPESTLSATLAWKHWMTFLLVSHSKVNNQLIG